MKNSNDTIGIRTRDLPGNATYTTYYIPVTLCTALAHYEVLLTTFNFMREVFFFSSCQSRNSQILGESKFIFFHHNSRLF